jgi:hypothetical protein
MSNRQITFRASSHSDSEKEISLALVRESFGDVDMAYKEYYDWLFLQNPAGKGKILIAYDGDRPVGQVASIPCKYFIPAQNGPVTITLTMNVCVSPEYRGRGILTKLMDEIHSTDAYNAPFSIGVPNKDSMGGHLKNKYRALPLTLLFRPIVLSSYFANPVVQRLFRPFDIVWRKKRTEEYQEEVGRFDKKFDGCEDAQHASKIRQIRSADYLNWRYTSNPRRKYKIFATPNNHKIEAYLIARVIEIFGVRLGIIVDFVAKNDSKATKDLITNALVYFWESKVTFAAAACYPNCLEHKLLRQTGFFGLPNRFRPHPFAVCVKVLDEVRSSKEVLNPNEWFFMLGDYETV